MPGEPLRSAPLWPRRALLPARADVEAPGLLLSRIDLPIRRFAALLRAPEFLETETDGVLLPIKLPIREVLPLELPMLEILPELTAGCLTTVEADGLSIRIELLAPGLAPGAARSIRIELLAPGREPGAGLSIRIELPMREVLPELTRLLELVVGRLRDKETDGLLVLIEPPIRNLLPGLIRMPELLLIKVEPVELLLTEMLDEGLR